MKILDSALTYSNLAVKAQSYQPLLSGIKDLNNKTCVTVLPTSRNILRTTTIIPTNFNRTVFNSTSRHFSQWI